MPCEEIKCPEDARSDNLNRRLKTLKVSLWSQPNDTTTIRAAIKLKQKRPVVSIKNGFGKTMPPDRVATTARTTVWSWPCIISALNKKSLEFDRNKEYHRNTFSDQCLIRGLEKGGVSGKTLAALFS